jgi:very-short-patch-repair endonuclease
LNKFKNAPSFWRRGQGTTRLIISATLLFIEIWFYYCMSIKNPRTTLEQRRELRRNQTKAEEILWNEIRARKLGVKFRRQYGIGPYILDFYAPSIKLAIEADGGIHLKKEVQIKDRNRDAFLNRNEIRVLRFKNEEIENELDMVLSKIKIKL